MKTRRLERAVGAGLLAALIAIALFSSIGADAGHVDGSVASAQPTGRRALFLTLAELGLAVEAWDQAPGLLPRGENVLWLAGTPADDFPGASKRHHIIVRSEDDEDDAHKDAQPQDSPPNPLPARAVHVHRDDRIGLHSFANYRRFVEEGGTLVLAASAAAHHFLVDDLGFTACGATLDASHAAAGVKQVRTSANDLVTIDVGHEALFESLDPNGSPRELWTAQADGLPNPKSTARPESDRPFAIVVPEGSGSVVLLASDEFLANRSIGAHDHALAAVRLAEELGRGGRVLFDEYALGLWRPETALGVAFAPKLVLASLHAILLLVLFGWMQAFVRAFPRDPEPLELFSPLLRARALSALFVRARRPAALARALRRGVFDRLCVRARLRPLAAIEEDAPRDETSPASVGARRAAKSDPRVVSKAELDRFVSATGLTTQAERIHDLFVARSVRNGEDLAALDADLRAFEAEFVKQSVAAH